MSLEAQSPLRVIQAVLDRRLGVLRLLRTIHGLQEKMLEAQALKELGPSLQLGEYQLELVTTHLVERRVGFWAYTNPIDTGRCFDGSVRFNGDSKPLLVQCLYRRIVQLKQRFATRANDESMLVRLTRPK